MKRPLSQQDLGATIANRAREMRAFAHLAGNEIDIAAGQTVEQRFPATAEHPFGPLVHKERLPGWETKIVLTYSLDIVPDIRSDQIPAPRRRVRHLSVQWSLPGAVPQGELQLAMSTPIVAGGPSLLELFAPLVRLFFPLHDHVQHAARALAPIPVVDPTAGRAGGNVHHRTPVLFHFVVDDEDDDAIAGVTDRRRWH